MAIRARLQADSLSAWLDLQPIEARLDPKVLAIEVEAHGLRLDVRQYLRDLRMKDSPTLVT